MPSLYIIAGPNGAGKTTTAVKLLPEFLECVEYVNADNIARGISPFNPESVAFQAGRVMLERMRDLVEHKKDFAFETTLSAKSYTSFLRHCRKTGYNITLIFIWLDSPEIAKQRVRMRVEKGGHNIPDNVIESRYRKGIENFGKFFVNLSDDVLVFDNTGEKPQLVAQSYGDKFEIYKEDVFAKLMKWTN